VITAILTPEQSALIAAARERYGEDITPCRNRARLEDCFMDHGRYGYFLYFNTPDGSTHVVSAKTKDELNALR